MCAIGRPQLENLEGSRKRFLKRGLYLSNQDTKIGVKNSECYYGRSVSVWLNNGKWQGVPWALLCCSSWSSPGDSSLPKICTQWHLISRMKWTMVEVFIPRKWANTTTQNFVLFCFVCFLQSQFVSTALPWRNMSKHVWTTTPKEGTIQRRCTKENPRRIMVQHQAWVRVVESDDKISLR